MLYDSRHLFITFCLWSPEGFKFSNVSTQGHPIVQRTQDPCRFFFVERCKRGEIEDHTSQVKGCGHMQCHTCRIRKTKTNKHEQADCNKKMKTRRATEDEHKEEGDYLENNYCTTFVHRTLQYWYLIPALVVFCVFFSFSPSNNVTTTVGAVRPHLHGTRRQVIEDPSLAQELLRAFHTTDDPVCLTEVLRLLSTAAMAAPAAVTPEIQLVSESAVESAATSVPELAAESAAAELTTKSAAMELATESAATELATESAATAMTTELAAESESAAKVVPELAAESAVEYTTAVESVAELASESAAELASESAAESAAKSMPESAVESATTELATELTSESAAESASESAAVAKMATESSAAVAAAAEVVGLAPAMATVETLERLGFFLESCLEEKLLSRVSLRLVPFLLPG